MPQWTARRPPTMGVLFTDMVSYVGDILSYYRTALGPNRSLPTATQRSR